MGHLRYALSTTLLALLVPSTNRIAFRSPDEPAQAPLAHGLFARAPIAFVPNLGQWNRPARFVARFGAVTTFLEDAGWVLSVEETLEDETVRGAAVRMRFVGGVGSPEIVAEALLAGVHHYFLGNDPAKWRTGVERFARVRYRGLYPRVDAVCYEKEGRLEYDLLLEPGADLAGIDVEVEGAQGLRVGPDGALVVDTALGPLRQEPPVTYEIDAEGRRQELSSRHELRGRDRFGFVVEGWSAEGALVLDPGIQWSTFVGGSSTDEALAVWVDATGIVTIAGRTDSPGYPTTPGSWNPTQNGNFDAFVTRFDPSLPTTQQLIDSTFLGGSGTDSARALALDAAGVATIAGYSKSADYPTSPGAWDTTWNGDWDVTITRLDPSQPGTQQLVYSTFLGASNADQAQALSIDGSGVVTIAGWTGSPSYPTTPGAWDTTYNGGILDAFVTRLDPSLPTAQQLVYSTLAGGTSIDGAGALSVGPTGVVTIAGRTESTNYPTSVGAWDPSANGDLDIVVSRFDPSQPAAQQLTYSTFVGGGGWDEAKGLSVDASGVVTITGTTQSVTYPTTPGAWDTTNSVFDAFVTRLDPSLTAPQQLTYSTFVGGSVCEGANALSVDPSGVVTIVGATQSFNFPTTPGAWDSTHNGAFDAFVTRLDPSQSAAQLRYSTLLGGSEWENATALSVEASGRVTIVGMTLSTNYPTTPGAWDTTHNGAPGTMLDAFVTRLDMLPAGASPYGTFTPGCAGPLAIGVSSWPQVGNATFAMTCTSAPPNATGLLAFSGAGLATPLAILGAGVWVDPTSPAFFTVFVPSSAVGAAQLSVPIPGIPALAGAQAYAQFAWLGPSAPPPCPATGVSTSNALEITIQP